MILFITAVLLTAATAPVLAQAALPPCASPGFSVAVQDSGCQSTDVHCICSNQALMSSFIRAVTLACDPADRVAAVNYAQQLCFGSTSSSSVSSGSESGASTTRSAMATVISLDGTTTAPRTSTSGVSTWPTEIPIPTSFEPNSFTAALTFDTAPTTTSNSTATTSPSTSSLPTDTATLNTPTTAMPSVAIYTGGASTGFAVNFEGLLLIGGALGVVIAQ